MFFCLDASKASCIYCVSCSKFKRIGVQAGWVEWMEASHSGVGTPELEHLEFPMAATEADCSVWSHVPTSGKEAGMIPRSMQQLMLRYGFWKRAEM